MHLVCLGIVKKLILLWLHKGPWSVRLNSRAKNKISHLLLLIRSSTPKEFVRKPRSTNDIKHWKAVEFRTFLLYTGPVVLRNILRNDIYNHFLTLHIAMTILTCPNLCQGYFLDFAEALLENFVRSFQILYGRKYISHNVHNLLHLCSDVRTFGPIDNFSAFRFENFMQSIKKKLRKNEKPLQQLIKRYAEVDNILSLKSNFNNTKLYLCKHLHNNGPICNNYNVKSQYLQISNDRFYVNCKNSANNCCILKDDTYILVMNIIKNENNDIFFIGKILTHVKYLYDIPCESSQFGIKVMTIRNDNICSWPITNLLYKAWKIPYGNDKNTFAIFPLKHVV
ncbi:uncharacterized protein LOC143894215 [Temnothorax americanus]|uniref:uncharacterized protein LOC143894215 n=1 Tax=Temnothorax americanus TaxID=1964332 RepID=UPI0040698C8E